MRLDIAILAAGMPFDAHTIDQGNSLGGSESVALGLAEELGRRDHNVLVFTSHPDPQSKEDSRVRFTNIQNYEAYAGAYPHHTSIVQRIPLLFSRRSLSQLNILWQHDLPMIEAGHEFRSALWNIDRVAFVSQFHKREYERVYETGFDQRSVKDLFRVVHNAVDVPEDPVGAMPFDSNRILYTSRPERGLDVLLGEIFPKVLERNPKATVHICTYDNPTDRTAHIIQRCKELGAQYGDKVIWLPPQSKANLYTLMRCSGVLAYPCPSPAMPDFAEVSCITFMEAMQCGLPVATTRWGASTETLKGYSGAKLSKVGDHESMVKNILRLMERRDKGEAFGGGKDFSWKAAGDAWEDLIREAVQEKNQDKSRVFYHWLRRSEIEGCQYLVDQGLVGRAEAEILERDYSWLENQETIHEHYSQFTDDVNQQLERNLEKFSPEYLGTKDDEPRFGHMLGKIREAHQRKIQETGDPEVEFKILDFGCGHGWFGAFVALNTPATVKYCGLDFDANAISWAEKLAVQAGIQERVQFELVDDYVPLPEFDVGVLSEVLEHVLDPAETVARVEGCVIKGGDMLITVPFGPVEYATHNWTHCRQHLREFTRPDLTRMFSGKVEYGEPVFEVMPEGVNTATGDGWGHQLVAYRADHMPIKNPDLEEKLEWVVPRETLSTMLICGPGVEETLEWCLNSVRWISDEIVIGDNGMSPESKALAAKFGARLVEIPSPLEIGFGPARNLVLDECRMDWVLWIDDDEKFTDSQQLVKYLKSGFYRGWSVRQHHFGVDVDSHIDLPVRCFHRTAEPRNRFRGLVHEHPEMDANEGPGRVGRAEDLNIMHIGYEDERVRQGRFWRNAPLMERDMQENPDRKLQVQLICRDAMIMATNRLRENGGQVDDFVIQCAQQTITTFRERFLGKDWGLVEVSPVPFYSQAAQVLGGDIKARIKIDISRRGQGDPVPDPGTDPDVICFASMDDLRTFLQGEVKAKLESLEGPAWDALHPPE